MSDYDYGDTDGRALTRIGGAFLVIALIGGVWLFTRSGSGDTARPAASIETRSSAMSPVVVTSGATQPTAAVTTAPDPTTRASAPAIPSTAAAMSPTTIPVSTPAPTVASAGPTPGSPAPTTDPLESRTVTYDTLADGSPAPVVAIFEAEQITLTGAVPDQAAKDRLAALALANAKPGQDNVVNFITINPDVPANIGTRVVELTSARFPEGTAEIRPEHALELDRIVSIMTALPDVTLLVIGHADQRGDETRNYNLSAERASAVVDYLVSNGVAPSRLSSRAVGEADLLTLNDDDAALALNRRTEFILYGLLRP